MRSTRSLRTPLGSGLGLGAILCLASLAGVGFLASCSFDSRGVLARLPVEGGASDLIPEHPTVSDATRQCVSLGCTGATPVCCIQKGIAACEATAQNCECEPVNQKPCADAFPICCVNEGHASCQAGWLGCDCDSKTELPCPAKCVATEAGLHKCGL
jgi:hypothetical protein